MGSTEQSHGWISIVSLLAFVMKVGTGTLGRDVMLSIRLGPNASNVQGHREKDRKIRNPIFRLSISSNYRAFNRQHFGF